MNWLRRLLRSKTQPHVIMHVTHEQVEHIVVGSIPARGVTQEMLAEHVLRILSQDGRYDTTHPKLHDIVDEAIRQMTANGKVKAYFFKSDSGPENDRRHMRIYPGDIKIDPVIIKAIPMPKGDVQWTS